MPEITVDQPKHPLPQLTTFELSDYRRDLETAIARLGQKDPVSPALRDLHARLDAVIGEQESRAKLSAARQNLMGRRAQMISLPAPGQTAQLGRVLREYPSWSVFWDKRQGVWRAAEDDPNSDLYAQSPNPVRAPVVEQIFLWRVVHKLGMPTIAGRLNADPGRYPPPRPGRGWTAQTVYAILGNPKYTRHRVLRPGPQPPRPPRRRPRRPVAVDPGPGPPRHRGPRDLAGRPGRRRRARYQPRPARPRNPARGRRHPYRSQVRCRDCRRRMGRMTNGRPGQAPHVYYQCPHRPANPRDAADHPGHPRTVKAPETRLDQIAGLFFAEHVFGPRRAELLAAQLPATDAAARADCDAHPQSRPGRVR